MDLRCTHCGAEARSGARFCVNCGNLLQTLVSIPSEAVSNPPPLAKPLDLPAPGFQPPAPLADKFRSQHSAIEGERRQVTVLFGDIAEFTALSATLDPEDLGEIVRRAFELVTAEIHRFEGSINQYGAMG
jgi:zinc-ribbon domain